jgi:hypothetical protein
MADDGSWQDGYPEAEATLFKLLSHGLSEGD